MIEFNINEYVYVKLTDAGMDELKRQYNDLKLKFPTLDELKEPNTDINGFSKWQMHDLMNRFGNMIGPFLPIPFETTIRFEVKK
jgi:hypothetical protein